MKKLFFAICLSLALVACDTAEERAEKHYQSALELIDDGDTLRALVELRNVFELNGTHREARRLYAETVLDLGRFEEAYSQFLRLVEQYPGDEGANRRLAQLTIQSGNVQQARPFLDIALTALPDDMELQAMDALVLYFESGNSDRIEKRAEATQRARGILEQDPDQIFARQILITQNLRNRNWSELLHQVDEALKSEPDNRGMYRLRLSTLEQMGRMDDIEATLLTMARRFEADQSIQETLVRWYVGHNRREDAESWLRGQVDDNSSVPEPRLNLVNFLIALRGEEAALKELTEVESRIPLPKDVAANFGTFASVRAGLMFNLGEREGAMVRLESLIKETGAGADEKDRMKVALAQMRETVGNSVGARALIDEVLERDASQVGALKMQADWLIAADDTAGAVAALREALDQEPTNASVLTLLARAYERQGSRELMVEMLVRAVEASGRAPEESMQLARILERDGQLRTAENVLVEALRLDTYNVDLLYQLGRLHIEMSDWSRVNQDIERLRDFRRLEANEAADELEAEKLLRQSKVDDLMTFVENRIVDDNSGEAGVVRALVLTGKLNEAYLRAKDFYEADPEDQLARFVFAATLTYLERDAEALPLFEALVEENPDMIPVWSSIYAIHERAQDMQQAEATLARAEAAKPDDLNLKWLRAGHLESLGDLEGAIAIYEEIYAKDSNLPVIANNLASLLTAVRTDQDSFERAYIVARRLRDTEVPEFADTYGWIAFLRGDFDDAQRHLELSANALPNEASVQYHLGRTYLAQGNARGAEERLNRAKLLVDQGGRSYPGLPGQIEAVLKGLAAFEAQASN